MSAKKIIYLSTTSASASIAKSPECITPSAFDTTSRQQSAKGGMFNLISTMIGGGVLSLPFAVSRAGLLFGFMLLTLSAITSIFSFDILVSSSRRTGASTYQQIGYFAFGKKMSSVINLLILSLTFMAGIGYCVLVGDLLKPLLCYIGSLPDNVCSSEWLRRLVIAAGICCVAPFCYMRQIKTLRYTSLMGIIGVAILALIITMTTVQNFGKEHDIYYINGAGESIRYAMSNEIKLFPTSFEDTMYVFPVFGISFMCHFNIPQVHAELTRPTRQRMRYVLVSVVISCAVLYSFIAFFGYFYSFGYTCGNILLNYEQNSLIISVARLCLGCVVLFSFPLLMLPARNSLHNLLNVILPFESMNLREFNFAENLASPMSIKSIKSDVSISCIEEDVNIAHIHVRDQENTIQVHRNENVVGTFAQSTSALLGNMKRQRSDPRILTYDTFSSKTKAQPLSLRACKQSQSTYSLINKSTLPSPTAMTRSFMTRSYSNLDSPLRNAEDALGVINDPSDVERLRNADFTKHFGDFDSAKDYKPTRMWLIGESTILIALSLTVAFLTSSVMAIWALVGSTVTFVIAFTLPGLFYAKIRRHKGWRLRNVCAVIIAVVSSFVAILCTWQAVINMDVEPCPFSPPSHSLS